MSRRIQILSDVVANQIAAGEVVERPASAVKELVENALDARASRVEIVIERGGKRKIRVSDDGIGMGREDALLSLDRHATSKISSATDLNGVRTFGFRGEALPSIAAVSRLVLDTSEAASDAGTRIVVTRGGITSVEDQPRRRGTTVEVQNLFQNAPARAKFLKSVAAEARAVSEAVTGLALANPTVGFTLDSDDRRLLDLPAVEEAAARVTQIWGGDDAGTLVPAGASHEGWEVMGLIQRPDAVQRGVRRAYLFVDGRPFRSPELLRAVDQAYRTTVPEKARPWLFLYFRAPFGQVDVNVHPAKAEVRFRDRTVVENLVEKAVLGVLEGESSSATFDTQIGAPSLQIRESGSTPSSPQSEVPEAGQMALFWTGDEAEAGGGEAAGEEAPAAPGPAPRLWQVLNTYIFAETRDGVLIIDQHSAHERIMFERLMAAYQEGGEVGQRLLFPLTVRLTPLELERVEELSSLLERSGFEVEPFGGDTVIVHSVPNPHPYFDADRAFREMVEELTHGSELVRSAKNQHERIAMSFACKGSIKAGQRLSPKEMQELFDQLFATELPHHDVHGRPTIIRLSGAELARRFGR